MEDKSLICISLAETLKATWEFRHLEKLVYYREEEGREFVRMKATWGERIVDVTHDSGFTLIADIMEQLRRWKR